MDIIKDTNLTGDVRFDGICTDSQMAEFLGKLDFLMREYRIIKIDVAYNPYAFTSTHKEENRTIPTSTDYVVE